MFHDNINNILTVTSHMLV